MLDFFKTIKSKLPASSYAQQNTQSANAAIELTSQISQEITGPLNITNVIQTSFAQAITSSYAFFRADLNFGEKMIQLLQVTFSLVQTGLAIGLLFSNENNEHTESPNGIYRALALFKLLYNATLLVAWGPSEISKAEPNKPSKQIESSYFTLEY